MNIKSPYRVWFLHQLKHQGCDLAYFSKQIHYDRNNSLSLQQKLVSGSILVFFFMHPAGGRW